MFGYVAGSLGALTVSSALFFANVCVELQAEKAAQLASIPNSKKNFISSIATPPFAFSENTREFARHTDRHVMINGMRRDKGKQ